jgi:hypothetical protein
MSTNNPERQPTRSPEAPEPKPSPPDDPGRIGTETVIRGPSDPEKIGLDRTIKIERLDAGDESHGSD